MLLQAVLCIKASLNNKGGLKEIIKFKDFLNRLVLCFDVPVARIKIALFEILSTLILVHSEKGHELVMEAFDFYKFQKREEFRFQAVVQALKFEGLTDEAQIAAKTKVFFFFFLCFWFVDSLIVFCFFVI
jgi:hypothetical protein